MTEFDGNCSKCKSDEVGILSVELQGDFIVVRFVCDDCGNEFYVSFDNGKILED